MSKRAGIILGIAVAALVLLAVVAGVLSATRDGGALPQGSPEATVQDYLTRVYDRDSEGAVSLLDPAEGCTVEDLEMNQVDRAPRVVLRDSRVDGDRATVRVELVHGEGGPFGGGEWTDEQVFRLRDTGAGWVITDEPWPMFHCGAEEKP